MRLFPSAAPALNRMDVLRGMAKPEPPLSVGPRTPALVVLGTSHVVDTLTRAGVWARPLQELRMHGRAILFLRVSPV